jgi:hypothetical protein
MLEDLKEFLRGGTNLNEKEQITSTFPDKKFCLLA